MAPESNQTMDGLLLKENKLASKGPRPNFVSITEVGSFQPQDTISFRIKQVAVIREWSKRRKTPTPFIGEGNLGPAVPFFIVYERRRREGLFSDFGTSGAVEAVQEKRSIQAVVETTEDARQRLIGHERLTARIYSLIQELLFAFGTNGSIQVRPAWSHEYDDSTGVVIDVKITADDDLRFLLWDSLSEKLAALQGISEDEEKFLHNNISLFVTTRE
jgi:hypothetical protein